MELTKQNIDDIKSFIDEQLRLRCINVETTLKVEEVKNQLRFVLDSTEFNTVPVLHSPIKVQDFGSSIQEVNEEILVNGEQKILTRLRINIDVSARYEGNGVHLFGVHGIINKGNEKHVFLQTERF